MRGNLHLIVFALIMGGLFTISDREMQFFFIISFTAWLYYLITAWTWRGILISFFIFGTFLFTPQVGPAFPPTNNLEGTISSPLTETPSYFRTTLSLTDSHQKAIVQYYKNDEAGSEYDQLRSQLRLGASCIVFSEYQAPESARNPGQFDYQKYLEHQNIFYEVTLSASDEIICEGSSVLQTAYDLRQKLIQRAERSMNDQTFMWASALVFGDTTLLPPETVDWFRDFNVSHLLAISGLHVGLFIGGMFFFLYRSGLTTLEQSRWLLLVIIPVYAFIAGAAPSVLRSSIMAVVILFLVQMKVRVNITDVISFVALVLLLSSPHYIHNLGFQFSFLVTFALILSTSIFKEKHPLIVSVEISLISQLCILTLQLHHFYQFNPLSLLANFILVPYFSLLIIPILILLVLISITLPLLGAELSEIFGWVHNTIFEFLMNHSDFFNIQWVVGEIEGVWVCAGFIFFTLMMKNWILTRLSRAFSYGVLFVLLLFTYSLKPYFSSEGYVTMLDVGQGDAFVIELPYRRGVIMIDAAGPSIFSGNQDRIADQIISPFLKAKGISELDAIIISHKDQDHSGSVESLLNSFAVENVYVNPYDEMETGLKKTIQGGQSLTFGSTVFHFLHPSKDYSDPNENSLVTFVELGGRSWLFTGDISKNVEMDILKRYPSLSSGVLKVGHHGSETSTSEEWLNRLNPSVALVSAGKENRYGHPHEEVLSLLEDHNITILRTDTHGAVTYKFSGESGTFSTHLPYNAKRK
ncbi:DNA internalization-related competence protein ComEC/Rec2 [Halobacillus sp. A1]|uniref:DNA internalization-related competence protein ComEC/Rec2 n=1 Tax=Halobacillus sp. A1 TaxID=2880262 RepID=UPI003531D12E